MSNAASFVLCVFCHRDSLHFSPLLKNTCIRQVGLDKWFPPEGGQFASVAEFAPRSLCTFALEEISRGEEACICYLPDVEQLSPAGSRRALLRQGWGFHCECRRCLGGRPLDARLEGLAPDFIFSSDLEKQRSLAAASRAFRALFDPASEDYDPPRYSISYDITLYYTISLLCYVMLCYVMLCYVMLYHVISYHIISYHIISCHIIDHIISYHIIGTTPPLPWSASASFGRPTLSSTRPTA